MNITKKTGIIIINVIIVLISIFFIIYDHNRITNLYNEYESLQFDNGCKGVVKKIFIEKGAYYITLGSKKILFGTYSNKSYPYPERDLYEILSIGDSLEKRIGSDTLFLYKANKCYMYKLIIDKNK